MPGILAKPDRAATTGTEHAFGRAVGCLCRGQRVEIGDMHRRDLTGGIIGARYGRDHHRQIRSGLLVPAAQRKAEMIRQTAIDATAVVQIAFGQCPVNRASGTIEVARIIRCRLARRRRGDWRMAMAVRYGQHARHFHAAAQAGTNGFLGLMTFHAGVFCGGQKGMLRMLQSQCAGGDELADAIALTVQRMVARSRLRGRYGCAGAIKRGLAVFGRAGIHSQPPAQLCAQRSVSTAASLSPIQHMTGTAMELPSALYRGPSFAMPLRYGISV